MRQLRDLTRTRASIEDDRTRVVNRIHKVLEDANIKRSDPDELEKLARGRLKNKGPALREALRRHVSEHHRFMLRTLLDQVRAGRINPATGRTHRTGDGGAETAG